MSFIGLPVWWWPGVVIVLVLGLTMGLAKGLSVWVERGYDKQHEDDDVVTHVCQRCGTVRTDILDPYREGTMPRISKRTYHFPSGFDNDHEDAFLMCRDDGHEWE